VVWNATKALICGAIAVNAVANRAAAAYRVASSALLGQNQIGLTGFDVLRT
jgi:hypothetical protein